MNLILEHSPNVPYYTDMTAVMKALGNRFGEYDWLISAIDGGFWDEDAPQFDDPTLIDGPDLESLLNKFSGQFTWAVFSAFPRGVRIDTAVYPYADGNPAFWRGTPAPQHPNAQFEIVCWDSSATLLIGIPDEMANLFRLAFPDAQDLDALNAARS